MHDLTAIFAHSHCVSKAQLLAYIRGKLDREESYLVESHMNDCQFCNDALDALLEADLLQAENDLSDAKVRLSGTLFPETEKKRMGAADKNNVRKLNSGKTLFRRLLAAASVLLLIGLGGYTVFSFIQSNKKQLSMKENGKGGGKYDAEYSKAESEDNEIAKLNIEANDTFRKYAEDDLKGRKINDIASTRRVNAGERENEIFDKIAKTEVKSAAPATLNLAEASKSVRLNEERAEEDLTPAAPSIATDNARIDPSPGMENFARANKDEKQAEVTKDLQKKKSTAGMKYDNNVQSNQMNYPRGNNNDFAQQRNQESPSVQKVESEIKNEVVELSNFENGMENFNKKNYTKSISYFVKALRKASGTEREDILYHLALAYEYTGKTEKANEIYASLSNSKKYGENAERKLKEAQAEEATKK